MRESILYGLKAALYLSAIAALVCFARLEMQLTKDVHLTAIQAQQAATEVQNTARAARQDVAKIAPEAQKALHAYRGLADTLRKATLDERDAIQEFNQAGVDTVHHLDSQIANLKTAEMSDAFLGVAEQSRETLKSTTGVMNDVGGLIRDPQVGDTIAEMHDTFSGLAGTAENFNKMSGDFQVKFHSILFPPPKPWYLRTWDFAKLGAKVSYEILTLK